MSPAKSVIFYSHHCVKSVQISKYGVFSDLYFPAFRLNTERYEVFLPIQSEYGKYGPEKIRIWTLFTQCIVQT